MTFRQSLQLLEGAQKPGSGVPAYTRWVNRRLARYIAAGAVAAKMTANMVTVTSALFSLAGLATLLLAPVSWWSGCLAAALLLLGYIFDSADGQVARLTATGGPAGEWFDHVVDAVRTPAIHLTIVIVAWRLETGVALWVGSVALAYALVSAGQFMSQILAEQLRHNRQLDAPSASNGVFKSIVLLPTDTGMLCLVFFLWGEPTVFGIVYSLLFFVNALHTAFSMRRKYLGLRGFQSKPSS